MRALHWVYIAAALTMQPNSHTRTAQTLATKWEYVVVATPDLRGPFPGDDESFREPIPIAVDRPTLTDFPALNGRAGVLAVIEVTVSTKGTVGDVRTLQASTPAVARRIRNVVRRWRFHPATLNGSPVRVLLRITVHNSDEKRTPDTAVRRSGITQSGDPLRIGKDVIRVPQRLQRILFITMSAM